MLAVSNDEASQKSVSFMFFPFGAPIVWRVLWLCQQRLRWGYGLGLDLDSFKLGLLTDAF